MLKFVTASAAMCLVGVVFAQTPASTPPPGPPQDAIIVPGPSGRGEPPSWLSTLTQEDKLVEKFDRDNNGWLNAAERKEARAEVHRLAAERGPRPGPTPQGTPGTPGRRVSANDVPTFPTASAFAPEAFRTFFLEFDNADWEEELADFRFTDVDVTATLTIDGEVFRDVGVSFRGASSFIFVPSGRKRSLDVSLDFVHEGQNFKGYRTFNLLNSNGDPTMLKAVLYFDIARQYLPAAKANFARVVVNGESWGVYTNVQQVDRDFVNEWWPQASDGTRWKAAGSPWGRGGLNYLGPDIEAYRPIYEIKNGNSRRAWNALAEVTRILTNTPLDELERALEPVFDIDMALRFLAVESALINDDGYWIRKSDYNLFLDSNGKLHVFPHDGNEAFYDVPAAMRGDAARGTDLDPFIGSEDPEKVLLSRLVAVPALRARYIGYVKEIADTWLDWSRLGPIALRHQALIAPEVRVDTRKLASTEEFDALVEGDFNGTMGLKTFADQRRAFLRAYQDSAR